MEIENIQFSQREKNRKKDEKKALQNEIYVVEYAML